VSILPIIVEVLRARSGKRDQRYDEQHERDRVIREDIRGED
jgi:membrane-associated protein